MLDMLNETPTIELAITHYVKNWLHIDEGFAFTSLEQATQEKTINQTNQVVLRAVDICDALGTGEQVILQGTNIFYKKTSTTTHSSPRPLRC